MDRAIAGTKGLIPVLSSVPFQTFLVCYLCGAGWGLGGLTFGLTMRYLGLNLGMAVALGLTTVIGTMGPPVFRGTLEALAATSSGRITFVGIAIVVLGIIVVAMAGGAKERQLAQSSGNGNKPERGEFDLRKGLLIA